MKKILCIFSALLIVLGAAFFGCGKKNDKAAAEQSETAAPTTESTTGLHIDDDIDLLFQMIVGDNRN